MKWGDPTLSGFIVGTWLTLLTVVWGGLVAGVGGWQRRFRLPDAPPVALPRLSICVPARNEVDNIGACVVAALASDHPDIELNVVDDASTDGTAEAARAAAAGDRRFRLVAGADLPSGWAGKPWACTRAVAEASGAHLLFIDADVVLAPSAARRAATVLIGKHLSLLSVFGAWRLESFWEWVVIPVVGWFIRGATDVEAVNTPGRPEAFANGQFILVDRLAYESVGGHGAVRAEVLDDVRLARAFKQHGQSLGLYAAPDLFAVRLYRSLPEIIAGYGKNLYEGMDRRPHVAVLALVSLAVSMGFPWLLLGLLAVWPALVLPEVASRWPWVLWTAGVCALPILLRWRLERADGRAGWRAWSHPLGSLVLAWVLLRAIFAVQTTWKGRHFHDGKAR